MSTVTFQGRVHRPERLDAAWHDPASLGITLEHIAGVNRWLGGGRVVVGHLAALLPAGHPARVLDVGTGSADIPRRIIRWARRGRRSVSVVALDLQRQVAAIAREQSREVEGIRVMVGNGCALPLADRSVDVAIASLTVHHLSDDDAVAFVRELARVSRHGLVVHDLERHPVNYLGARVLAATVWRRSPYAEDGPISVRRSFRPGELRELGDAAGLRNTRVYRHFPYRLALVASP